MLTMLFWGFNFIAIKLSLQEMTPGALGLVRTLIAYAVLLPICWAKGISLRYPAGEVWRILLQGALAMGIYLVVFLEGMKYSTPAEGAIILGTGPAFTLLFAVLVKQEQFRWRALVGMLIAFCGVVVVVLSGPSVHSGSVSASDKLMGNLLVLVAAVIWAISVVVTRPLVGKIEPLRMFTLSMPGAIAALLPFGLLPSLHTDYTHMSATGWWMLLYVAVIAGALGFALFYEGIKQVGASGAMTYQYFVSPLAAIFGWVVMKIPMTPLQFVGLVVVLLGVGVSSSGRNIPAREALPEVPE